MVRGEDRERKQSNLKAQIDHRLHSFPDGRTILSPVAPTLGMLADDVTGMMQPLHNIVPSIGSVDGRSVQELRLRENPRHTDTNTSAAPVVRGERQNGRPDLQQQVTPAAAREDEATGNQIARAPDGKTAEVSGRAEPPESIAVLPFNAAPAPWENPNEALSSGPAAAPQETEHGSDDRITSFDNGSPSEIAQQSSMGSGSSGAHGSVEVLAAVEQVSEGDPAAVLPTIGNGTCRRLGGLAGNLQLLPSNGGFDAASGNDEPLMAFGVREPTLLGNCTGAPGGGGMASGQGAPVPPLEERRGLDGLKYTTESNARIGMSAAQYEMPLAQITDGGQRFQTSPRQACTSNLCSKCGREEVDSMKRARFCKGLDNADCSRWVCKNEAKDFNASLAHKCCKHHAEIKSRCECSDCTRKPRSQQLMVGQRRGVKKSGTGLASRGVPSITRAAETSVFVLPYVDTAETITVSVCISRPQTRVVASVNFETGASRCCARKDCNKVSNSVEATDQTGAIRSQGKEPAVVAAAAASAADAAAASASPCEHASLALSFLRRRLTKKATPIMFGGEQAFDALETCAKAAADRGFLSDGDAAAMLQLGKRAREKVVPPLVRLGRTGFYAVFEEPSQTCELGWAHARDVYPIARAGRDGVSRGVKVAGRLVCKANRGSPCQENKSRNRKKCIHTLAVALVLWAAEDMSSEGLLV